MSREKTLALTGLLLLLGAGMGLAQEQKQATVSERARNKAQTLFQDRTQNRMRFQDQNGDGINDYRRDYDNDGIPNCQDPDWIRPEDGNGYQNRNGQGGQGGSQAQLGARKSFQAGRTWTNRSFRSGRMGLGGGICDGRGPQGKGIRRGRR